MARGDGGRDVFVEDEDRKAWLGALGKTCVKHGWRVHAFVLMGNHFHLLLETPEPNLVSGMKWLMGVFSQGWNRRRLRRGHVFQGRYKAVVVNDEEKEAHYLRVVADYIHLNPVRSAWVGGETGRKLKEYAWSSFSHYNGRKAPDWLEMDWVTRPFELAEGKAGRQAYARYLEARATSREGTMNDASLKELRRGWYLGEKAFAETASLCEDFPSILSNFPRVLDGLDGIPTASSSLQNISHRNPSRFDQDAIPSWISEISSHRSVTRNSGLTSK